MTLQRNIGDSGEPRKASQESGATSWPVLAQLPRIGGATNASPTAPTFAAIESAGRYDLPTDERLPGGAALRPPSEQRRRFSVDRSHAVRSYDGLAGELDPAHDVERAPTSERLGRVESPSARHVRIDRGAERRLPAGHAQAAPETLASRAFRLHSAMAPHLGLVGAAALILSGGLLYWLAFGQWGSTTTSSEAPHLDGGWSSDAAVQAEPGDLPDAAASVTANSGTTHAWTAAPRMANATATNDSSSDGQRPAPSGDGPAPPAPATAPAATPTPAETGLDSAAWEAEGPAITPTPNEFPYPFTPYAAFPFDAAVRVNVAGRPTTSSPMAPR